MGIAALNNYEARNSNLAAVLEAVHDDPGRSRSEINGRMPFSLQTMTNVVQELVGLGLVTEVEKSRPGSKGGPHRGLYIEPGRCHVLGLQIRWTVAARDTDEYVRGAAEYLRLRLAGAYLPSRNVFKFDLYSGGAQAGMSHGRRAGS
ncbi:helix-turn-helix domain-containing protein [Devosia algicola]|uniref:Helix-turn-helix domain-containing protein n=1 Tax=Devosia algicola TaxID=3026418 RepID=A0ABY7YP76_9HYPH|nr:helix-turn-helix domain-containing protein [Devosia algicola]WDR03108.1 helix-turn-helix domain-containing protein [Devosia algicola]